MAAKYVPPHMRRKQSDPSSTPTQSASASTNACCRTRIMFFGDSFVRLFGLVEHPEVRLQAFKGASAKGVGRDGNLNRYSILREVRKHQPDRVVLCFGNVDVQFSYFYTSYVKEGPPIDLRKVAEDYVDFAASLSAPSIHIVAVYPATVKDDHILGSLAAYNAVPSGTDIPTEDLSIRKRQQRVQQFNGYLQAACDRHHLHFENAFDEMIDPETFYLKPSFQDVSSYNVHVVWETTILLWMDRWPWLKELVGAGFERKIQATLEEYLQTKSWAKETHIAANIGVNEAFDLTKTEM